MAPTKKKTTQRARKAPTATQLAVPETPAQVRPTSSYERAKAGEIDLLPAKFVYHVADVMTITTFKIELQGPLLEGSSARFMLFDPSDLSKPPVIDELAEIDLAGRVSYTCPARFSGIFLGQFVISGPLGTRRTLEPIRYEIR